MKYGNQGEEEEEEEEEEGDERIHFRPSVRPSSKKTIYFFSLGPFVPSQIGGGRGGKGLWGIKVVKKRGNYV